MAFLSVFDRFSWTVLKTCVKFENIWGGERMDFV